LYNFRVLSILTFQTVSKFLEARFSGMRLAAQLFRKNLRLKLLPRLPVKTGTAKDRASSLLNDKSPERHSPLGKGNIPGFLSLLINVLF
ncbi:hypothetical protein, partial [Novacetimonas hansenii]|uniref:hypothetical protein n=2 Tax=Novacetimonas hansenii TaxID=436 RepID=UPI001A7E7245